MVYPAAMARPLDHPNDPGRWTVVETATDATLWRRERDDPFPVTLFYLVAPPRQPEVLYDEDRARALFAARTPPLAAAG
jgi:hypothetical protein